MSHETEPFFRLLAVFAAAQVGAEIAQRLRLPALVGEIAAGCNSNKVTMEAEAAKSGDLCENQPNATPMSALCRTIEIDLRQQLGEAEIPPPLQAVNGVLM